MTIGKRLIVLVAVPLLALVALGVIARIRLSEVEERSRFVAEKQLGSLAALAGISAGFEEMRVSVRNLLLAFDQSERAVAHTAFDTNDRTLAQLLQQYGGSLVGDELERNFLRDVEALNRQYTAESKEVMALAESGRHDEALAR